MFHNMKPKLHKKPLYYIITRIPTLGSLLPASVQNGVITPYFM